jgi:hypothetical protein
MVRRLFCVAIVLTAVLTTWGLAPQMAQAQVRTAGPSDLFYNYYVPPGTPAGVGAQMYPAPRPTPPLVGHTYVTYQPLMPQEFLYEHHRVYWRQNCDAGWTRTSVCWKHIPTLWPFTPSLTWSMPALHPSPASGIPNPCTP